MDMTVVAIPRTFRVVRMLPNAIGVFRTALAWLAIYMMHGALTGKQPAIGLLWFCVFVVAVALDALDGWLARKFNVASDFGSYVDILADRLTEYPAWILLAYAVPGAWPLVTVIMSRNVLVDAVKFEAARKGQLSSAGVPRMNALGELLVNHPFCKTLHNVLKLVALFVGFAHAFAGFGWLGILAITALAFHTTFCVARGLCSLAELRSIWRAKRGARSSGVLTRYGVQVAIGAIVLSVLFL